MIRMNRIKNTLVVGIIGMFLLTSVTTLSVAKTTSVTLSRYSTAAVGPGPELLVEIVGSLRLLGIRRVGGVIANTGDATAHDVCYTFMVTGGFDDSIDFTYDDSIGDILMDYGIGLCFTRTVNGFGPITITLTATASNVDEVTESAKGFQIGFFTLVLGK